MMSSVLSEFELEFEALESDHVDQQSSDEEEELLDNMGYISIFGNQFQQPNPAEVLEGIEVFRAELERTTIAKAPNPGKDAFLSEEEVDFLETLSSLEGEFRLHLYGMAKIKSDPLLIRVLNFRFTALSLYKKHPGADFSPVKDVLNQLKRWSKIDSTPQLIRKMGNVEELIADLNNQDAFEGSSYDGIIFFKNPSDTIAEKSFRNNKQVFRTTTGVFTDRARAQVLPIIDQVLDKNQFPKKNRKKVELFEKDRMNQFFIRLLLLKLWLQGTYDGRLDEEMGQVGLSAIQDLASFVNLGEEKPVIRTKEFIVRLNKEHWAINARFLLSLGFQRIEAATEQNKTMSISEGVQGLADRVVKPEEKEDFYSELDTIIKEDLKPPAPDKRKRKKKSKSGKGFFRRVGSFFKRIGKTILKGLKAIKRALIDFFNWIKNGVRVLVREIKKAVESFKTTIKFVFGKREIQTGNLHTDYDFDFDVVTTQKGPINSEMITAHKKEVQRIMQQLHTSLDFLEKALPIILALLTPPLGWIKAGIKLVGLVVKSPF